MRVSTHSRAEAAAPLANRAKPNSAVSTHSRAEAAAKSDRRFVFFCRFQHTAARRRLRPIDLNVLAEWLVSTHSRAEAAAASNVFFWRFATVSTHSRAEAAALRVSKNNLKNVFQHTAARRRLHRGFERVEVSRKWFQHTAARRRLRLQGFTKAQAIKVSTHSRAEAAAFY